MSDDRDPVYHYHKEIFCRREPKLIFFNVRLLKNHHTMYPVVYEESADALHNMEWNAEGCVKEVEFFNKKLHKEINEIS